MAKVTVIGSLNVDLVVRILHFPLVGETVKGDGFATFTGGKGLNQAIAAARSGAKVAMIGAIGTDANGELLRDVMDAEMIDRRQVKEVPGESGLAVIEVNAMGENRIVVISGANSHLQIGDFDLTESSDVHGGDVLLGQFEINLDVLTAHFVASKSKGYLTILNPSPYAEASEELLQATDLMILNEIEIQHMTGVSAAELSKAANTVISRGPKAVIVTLGAAGSFYSDGITEYRQFPTKVIPVDTTGAGDTFCGSLAAELSHGKDVTSAMRYASVAAAISTTTLGAGPSMPTRSEVDAYMNSNQS